jgi:hypothetical protein
LSFVVRIRLYACCKEQNAQDAVGKDLPDMMTATSSIYEVNGGNDQSDYA